MGRFSACALDTGLGGCALLGAGAFCLWYLRYVRHGGQQQQQSRALRTWVCLANGLLAALSAALVALQLLRLRPANRVHHVHPSAVFFGLGVAVYHVLVLCMLVVGWGRGVPIPKMLPAFGGAACVVFAAQLAAQMRTVRSGSGDSAAVALTCCQIIVALALAITDHLR